jgi:2-polyprenyl-3-methyl-5-hydroxy-6-metoxy-1,4-benzoquinol methylase
MDTDEKKVILLIADISGYTQFMLSHQKALAHSQMIIGALLDTLIKEVDIPLQIAKLEGDAIFMYAFKEQDETIWQSHRRELGQRLLRFFHIFADKLGELRAYSICRCQACTNMDKLKLKIIVHSGEALFYQIGVFQELSGVDVITVHRLLKNSVAADQYILMTEPAYYDLELSAETELAEGQEDYDVGTLKTFLYLPNVAPQSDKKAFSQSFSEANVAVKILRDEIRREYTEVATNPARGFHFNTGRVLAAILGYTGAWYDHIPEATVDSFAGTGNPFSLGQLNPGEQVVDVGCGAGFDALIAARMVGPAGQVIGVDMTPAMLDKARASAAETGLAQAEFRQGYSEKLPVLDGWADVVISNGALNLSPDKLVALKEMRRVLKPGGRLQIGDILVAKPVPEAAKHDVDLWTN